MKLLVTIFLLCVIGVYGLPRKHVIFMHGILAGPEEVTHISDWLKKSLPGENITAIALYDFLSSLDPMWTQVSTIQKMVTKIMTDNPQGTHLICFSQGGLICRGLLSIMNNHNVHSFIALSSPLMGQYGDSVYLKYLFPKFLKSNLYEYFYSESGQKWSIANYWNDPHHQQLYMKYSNYLAILNNQTFNNRSLEFKANFLKIKNLVMIGGPDDGVITPWQSSHMGYYNSNETVVDMRRQPWYLNDWFGLKTLDNRKAIHTYTINGIQHVHWYRTKSVFDKCILPYLG